MASPAPAGGGGRNDGRETALHRQAPIMRGNKNLQICER